MIEVAALIIILAAAVTPVLPPDAGAAAEVITPAVVAAPVRFLSSDLLEGRAPSQPGDRLARAYLGSELEAIGLAPGGPEAKWEQRFPIVGIKTTPPATWRFSAEDSAIDLANWDEFIAVSGVQEQRAVIDDAEVVFVGYGIRAPEYQWDDFKGVDLKGKVLLMLNNDPDWDPALFAGERRLYYGRWDYKYASAARQGAVGAIVIHTTPSAGYPWEVVQNSWTGDQYELPADSAPRLQVEAWTTEDATRKMLKAAGYSLDALVAQAHERSFRPVPLGIHTSLTLTSRITRSESGNVLGLLEGSDPELKREVLVVMAHFDHLGVGAPDKSGDRIYNGARDNASGVAQVLAIARAFTALHKRPRRSVLFLFASGEESGLLGSSWFAAHPTVPAGRLAACINFDAGNIFGRTRDIALVGDGKSTMDEVAKEAAALQGRVVTPETGVDKGSFYRSDQFSLAKIGVPALYFKPGNDYVGRPAGWGQKQEDAWLATHYHRPSDEISADWDFSGLAEDAKLGFLAGLIVTQADAMPGWLSGDEFAPARAAALKALAEPLAR